MTSEEVPRCYMCGHTKRMHDEVRGCCVRYGSDKSHVCPCCKYEERRPAALGITRKTDGVVK